MTSSACAPGARTSRASADVIEPSRLQLSFAEGLIQEEVGPLWEEWMRQVDQVLADRELVQIATRRSLGDGQEPHARAARHPG